jgi:hypothetical protein
MTTCGVVPTPFVATLSRPGCAAAQMNKSSTLRSALDAGTTMPKVTPLIWMIGVVSRIGSQPTFWIHGARNTGCGSCAMV